MPPDLEPMIQCLNQSPTFDGQIIAVTGASRGIGRALAQRLASAGATVVLIAKHEDRLEAVYDHIVSHGGPEPVICALDLATLDADQAGQLAEQIEDAFGHLDGLVHMGAILGGREPIQTHRPNQWAQVMQVNLNAVFYLTQALMPLLDRATAGRIVMATSSVGYQPEAYWGAYAVSKAGLEMFTAMLAEELDNTSKTRVVTVNPGGTRTDMRAEAKPGEDPATLPRPEDVLDAFVFGLTEAAAAYHGQRVNARDLMAALGVWPRA